MVISWGGMLAAGPEAFCEASLKGKKVKQWREIGATRSFRQGLESIPS